MPTSVHIPRPLLEAVDKRARALRLSRNRLIVNALEKELRAATEWSPGFFERLAADDEVSRAVDDLLATVRAARRSKDPPRL